MENDASGRELRSTGLKKVFWCNQIANRIDDPYALCGSLRASKFQVTSLSYRSVIIHIAMLEVRIYAGHALPVPTPYGSTPPPRLLALSLPFLFFT